MNKREVYEKALITLRVAHLLQRLDEGNDSRLEEIQEVFSGSPEHPGRDGAKRVFNYVEERHPDLYRFLQTDTPELR